MEYAKALNTVDNVVLSDCNNQYHVLLIKRGDEPFKGLWALPGGYINPLEDPKKAAFRELSEETTLTEDEFFETYGLGSFVIDDPRGWTITTAYMHRTIGTPEVHGADDAAEAAWYSISDLPELAFGHEKLIMAAVELDRYHQKLVNPLCF